MKLIILNQVQNHINYLLTRFKGTEWSGPAFYSYKTDEDGFPAEWTLEGIVPLDLGSTASTEWGGIRLLPTLSVSCPNSSFISSMQKIKALSVGTNSALICRNEPSLRPPRGNYLFSNYVQFQYCFNFWVQTDGDVVLTYLTHWAFWQQYFRFSQLNTSGRSQVCDVTVTQ